MTPPPRSTEKDKALAALDRLKKAKDDKNVKLQSSIIRMQIQQMMPDD